MGGKAAIKEKVGTGKGRHASSSVPTAARRSAAPGPGRTSPARTVHSPVGREGGKPGAPARVRARPRVARVRLLSPEQRLVAAIRRTYRNAVAYFRETRLEMRKVVWPSRRETMVYTLVVVASTAIVGLVIWVFDIGLSGLLRLIIR